MRSSHKPIVVAAGLFALAFGAFYPCLRNGFITFDDGLYITGNPHVQGGFTWDNFVWAFKSLEGGIWHPLTWLSIMLDCQIYGLKPEGHHLTNVLLHAANATLLFLALKKMSSALWPSAFVAALFAVHPLHVESVAWAAERKDVLSGFFFMLTLLAYASHVRTSEVFAVQSSEFEVQSSKFSRPAYYLFALLFFFCGLMSKSMVVTLPLIMLLLDWWPLKRLQTKTPRALLIEKAPFFVVAILVSVLTMLAQHQLGALISAADLPLGKRIANAILSYVVYLGQMFWPARLAVFYPFPKTIPVGSVVFAGLLLFCLCAVAVRYRQRLPCVLTGWFWYLVTLLPVIGFIQVGSQAHADRYAYLAMIGVFTVATWGALELFRPTPASKAVFSGVGVAVIAAFLALTQQQISYWKDSERLFRRALAVTTDNRIAHDNLGTALLRQGQVDEAISHFKEALRLKPDDPEELNNLGLVLLRKGEADQAIGLLEQSLRFKADNDSAHYSLGLAYGQTGQLDSAQKHFEEALRLRPGRADAHCGLGIVLLRLKKPNEAIANFEQALRLNPRYPEAEYQLGMARISRGEAEKATESFRRAILLKPDYVDAHRSLAIVLGMQGRLDDAVTEFQNVLRISPDNAEAHCDLGVALAKKGDMPESINEFQKAVQLAPGSAEAHGNLGAALARSGKLDDGIAHLEEALRLRPDYPAARENLKAALNSKGNRQ